WSTKQRTPVVSSVEEPLAKESTHGTSPSNKTSSSVMQEQVVFPGSVSSNTTPGHSSSNDTLPPAPAAQSNASPEPALVNSTVNLTEAAKKNETQAGFTSLPEPEETKLPVNSTNGTLGHHNHGAGQLPLENTQHHAATDTTKSHPVQPGKPVKPEEAVKPNKAVKAVKRDEAMKPNEAVKAGEAVKPTKAVKLEEALKPQEAVKAVEAVKPMGAVKPQAAVEAVKPEEAAKPEEPVEPGEAVRPDETVQSEEAVKTDKAVKPKEAEKLDETVKPAKPVKSEAVVMAVEPVKFEEAVKPEEPVKREEPVAPEKYDTPVPGSASTYAARVPTNLSSFRGRRQDDVRQWLFHVETMCKIHAHDICDDNAILPAIAGLAVLEPASGWFLNWANTVPPEELVWGRFKIDVLAHFAASNYQATVRLKLLNLRQEGDIEGYNGRFAELIFRVEDMGELDRVSHYCIGLKHQTQSYVKLQNPITLSDALNLALKYEGAHFTKECRAPRMEERSDRRNRLHDRPPQGHRQPDRPFPKRPDLSRYKPKPTEVRRDTRKLKCFFCNRMGHLKRDCFQFKKTNGGSEQGNGAPHHLHLVSDHPLPYQSSPLIELQVAIKTDGTSRTARALLDCGATTTYLSRAFVTKAEPPVVAHPSRELRVQTGDGRTVSSPLELVHVNMEVPGVPTYYATAAMVYDLPDRIDCILGMPFFEEKQPQVDWKTRTISVTTPANAPSLLEKGSPVEDSGLQNAAQEEVLPATSADSLGVAMPETDKQQSAKPLDASREMACPGELDVRKKSVRTKTDLLFTMGVEASQGLCTKYIKRKHLRKLLRQKSEDPAQDFILVLTDEAIKKVKRDIVHPDKPDHVASEKARRFLDTDWE
ncbi:TPA: hypothetical protein N0F65_003717, partial [Lagenidium giganteum]